MNSSEIFSSSDSKSYDLEKEQVHGSIGYSGAYVVIVLLCFHRLRAPAVWEERSFDLIGS